MQCFLVNPNLADFRARQPTSRSEFCNVNPPLAFVLALCNALQLPRALGDAGTRRKSQPSPYSQAGSPNRTQDLNVGGS